MNTPVTQSWLTPFQPRPFLRNGHLQTLAGNYLPRNISLPEAESLLVEVDGPVSGYGPSYVLCHCHWQQPRVRAHRLTVILVHGLEGSSNSRYMIGNAARSFNAGFNVVRMNMRSCGGTDEICPTIYHSGRSNDVAAVLAKIVQDHGLESIAFIGYSMGGNLVLKFAGESAAALPPQLKAVVGVSPLMDLTVSSAALHEPQNRIYERHFLRNMLTRVRRRAQLFPAIYGNAEIGKIHTMRLFDEHIVARYGGFADADDYYQSVASSQYAARLSVPTLILHSNDDPFIRLLPSTRDVLIANPNVTYVETQHGGHCAFLESPTPGYDGRWAEKTLHGFLQGIPNGS
ncbi:MAG TPA: alpha/beta fold hydrolase [Acidobacteriaceae bacterium]|nr:alpha/beta fold hydrolase [Acidobacteriaceae bacterium]